MKEKLQELIHKYKDSMDYGDDVEIEEVVTDLEELLENIPDQKTSKFFDFRQNNSGGSFNLDPKNGISVIVIIEAPSDTIANCIAETKGIQFDSGCPCCGDRWTRAWDDGEDVPSYYGEPVLGTKMKHQREDPNVPEGYIHYLDGRIVPFW